MQLKRRLTPVLAGLLAVLGLAVITPQVAPQVRPGGVYFGRTSGKSSLLTGLQLYYSMNESAGSTRVDSTGHANLSDNGTVGSVAGKIGNAADFSVCTQFLSAVDNAFLDALSGSGGFTINAWIKYVSGASYDQDDGGSQRAFALFNDGNFYVFQTSATFTTVSHGMTNDATYHMVTVGWDPSDGKIFRYTDNGTANKSAATLTGMFNSTASFIVGRWPSGSGSSCMVGDVDELGMWSRVLTSAERGCLNNGGAAKAYPFTGVCGG